MKNLETLKMIRRLTISALVSDERLMAILVLKGGNALDLAYDISNRASIDIDFSIEGDFTEEEKTRLLRQISFLLENEFEKEGLVPIDIHFDNKPGIVKEAVKDFWGGYELYFKVISQAEYESHKSDRQALIRRAIAIHDNNSTTFSVDISKYEYVAGKKIKDLEGATIYVYSPEMLAIEKLRALCQQDKLYREIILSKSQKSRARDFYDIYNITQSFSIDFKAEENIELCTQIFDAKRVPLSFIKRIGMERELHRGSWAAVIATVNPRETLKDFDFYVDYVIDLFSHFS